MTLLILGLVVFFTVHTFSMFRPARQSMVDRLGANGYRGVYSLLALGGFALIVMGYGDAPRLEIWTPAAWMRPLTLLLMTPVFVLLVAAFVPGHIKARTRNPMLIALKTWAFAHLLSNGDLASIVLFTAFLLWAVADVVAVKRSARGALVAHPRVAFDILAVVVGTGLYAFVLCYAHPYIAGVGLLT
jgi:uncharacterized membrane protein